MDNKIYTKDLYLCYLGVMEYKDVESELFHVRTDNLYRKVCLVTLHKDNLGKIGVNPLTNVSYRYFHECLFSEFIGQVVMYKLIPLYNIHGVSKEYFTIEEIKILEEEFNRSTAKKDKISTKIKELIILANEITDSKIRLDILTKLANLGEYYVSELENGVKKKDSLIKECEMTLLNIEFEINEELKTNKSNSLLSRIRGIINDRK